MFILILKNVKSSVFGSSTNVFKNTFTERLDNHTEFGSNIFFKLSHSVWNYFVNDGFWTTYNKGSHRLKSGDLGYHNIALFYFSSETNSALQS